jgi:signal transduction histidine kinase
MMMDYTEARDTLVTQLRKDALAHDAQQYDAVGRRFDAIEHRFPEGTAPELGKLGLLGMQEGAAGVGGRVTVESAVGRGTDITVQLPATRSDPADGSSEG